MFRVYKEHPEFGEFTKFDTNTGRLINIKEEEFISFLPNGKYPVSSGKSIQVIKSDKAKVFWGEAIQSHTRFPRRIYFQITRNCNLECDYCFLKAKNGAPYVPTSAIMKVAKYMGENGLAEVRLTGGEPTTHPDFFDIVNKFQEEDVYVSIATNGVIGKKILDGLCQLKNIWLICSVDGNKKTHNRYRFNTFERIMKNLRYLKSKNPSIRLRLTTVLTKENMGQMFELGEICKSLDAESITVIPLRPQVRNIKMNNEIVSAQEFRQVIEDLVEVKEKLNIRFTTTIGTDYTSKIYKDPVFAKRSSCAAGREGTNLDYDPRDNSFILYGCSYSPAVDYDNDPKIRAPFLAGNFSIDEIEKFQDIWDNDNAWKLFRDLTLKSHECRECKYYVKHQCVGSCPIQNLDYSMIKVNKNVLKQLKEQIRNTSEWYCYKRILG